MTTSIDTDSPEKNKNKLHSLAELK